MNNSQAVAVFLGIVVVVGGAIFAHRNANRSPDSLQMVISKIENALEAEEFIREKADVSVIIKDDRASLRSKLSAEAYPKISLSFDTVASHDTLFKTETNADPKVSSSIKILAENFGENSFSAEVDLIILKRLLFYARLNDFESRELPKDEKAALGLSLLTGRWWKVDLEELIRKFAGLEADRILESSENRQLSAEDMEKLKAILKKYQDSGAVRFEKLADSKIENAPVYHWNIILDETQLADMVVEILNALARDSERFAEIKASDVENFLKMIDIKPIELLVAKKDYLPAQVKFAADISDKDGRDLGSVDVAFHPFRF